MQLKGTLLHNPQGVKNILLLSLVILVTYLFATKTGILILDDMFVINKSNSLASSLSVFFSGGETKYFRPLGYLSYNIDTRFFGCDPIELHFVNILIHICNSILVYCVALYLTHDEAVKQRTAMVAALVFGLHPVNSEAVIWIASRFDLLSCFFFLLCLLLILRNSASGGILPLTALFPLFLASLLSKESSILFPVAVVVFIVNERKTIAPCRAGAIMATLAFSILFYLYMRNGLAFATDKGIGNAPFSSVHGGTGAILAKCMEAMGFYIKKMLYPYPLSFAISSINSVYYLILFALFFVLLSVLLFRRRDLRFPVALSLIALIPPLYAMVSGLPWTPYAERYLYIPMTGFALVISLACGRFLKRLPPFFLFCLIFFLAVPTAWRVKAWIEPVTFWEDTIDKSPRFGTPHLLLAAELISAGKLDEAEQHLTKARELGITRPDAVIYAHAVDAALNDARKKTVTP